MAAVLLATLALIGAVSWNLWQDYQDDRRTLTVPDLRGKTLDEARGTAGAELELTVASRENSEQPKGTVISQDPTPSEQAEKRSTISVVLSDGSRTVEVPNVVGMNGVNATLALSDAGLSWAGFRWKQSPRRPTGIVIATDPPTGTEVEPRTEVTTIISSGPSTLK